MSGPMVNPAFHQTSSVVTECAQVYHGHPSGIILPGNFGYSPTNPFDETILPHVSVALPAKRVNPYKQDYLEARSQLAILRNDIIRARKRLIYFSFVYKYLCFAYNVLQNGITLASAIVVSGVFGTFETAGKILPAIAFLLSFSNWFRLGEKGQASLSESNELKQAENLCDEVQSILDDAIVDDVIDSLEHDQILDSLRKMYLAAESISFMGMFVNIMSDTPIGGNTQTAVKGIRGIVGKVSKKGTKIAQKFPDLARDARIKRSYVSVV